MDLGWGRMTVISSDGECPCCVPAIEESFDHFLKLGSGDGEVVVAFVFDVRY